MVSSSISASANWQQYERRILRSVPGNAHLGWVAYLDYGTGKEAGGSSRCRHFRNRSPLWCVAVLGRMITRNVSGFTLPIRRRGLPCRWENENCPVSFISAGGMRPFQCFWADLSEEGPRRGCVGDDHHRRDYPLYEEKTGRRQSCQRRGKKLPQWISGFFQQHGEGGRRVSFFRPLTPGLSASGLYGEMEG